MDIRVSATVTAIILVVFTTSVGAIFGQPWIGAAVGTFIVLAAQSDQENG